MEPTPKVVLVTGASSGIGEAVALRLAEEGHQIVAGARRQERLDALAQRRHHIRVRRLDVTDRADVDTFIGSAIDEFGRVDVLVNNAGLMPLSRLDALLVDEWDRMLDVNVRGLLYGVVESELAETISDPGAREAMKEYRRHAIPPEAIARAVSFAIAQPADVDVNEVIVRPTRQRG